MYRYFHFNFSLTVAVLIQSLLVAFWERRGGDTHSDNDGGGGGVNNVGDEEAGSVGIEMKQARGGNADSDADADNDEEDEVSSTEGLLRRK